MRSHHPELGVLPKRLLAKSHAPAAHPISPGLRQAAALDVPALHAALRTSEDGLSAAEAKARLAEQGPNILARDRRPGLLRLVGRAAANPLVILLAVLAVVSVLSGDARAAAVMGAMIVLSLGLRLTQEAKASRAAAQLEAMISVTASVVRDGIEQPVPVSGLVPGDLIRLAAGDMIPGDVRITHAKDLFVSQGALTGESFPVEKFSVETQVSGAPTPWALTSVAFLGSSVASGSATAVVVATGQATVLGGLARSLQQPTPPTAFDRGVSRFTLLMLGFMAVMVPMVFLLNGLTKGSWSAAFFFAIAVAVGLTPELLPMIVTICLSKGALALGRKKVIVKRINAIQDLGAMDVLCTDKTGTLTRDEIVLERHCDVMLRESDDVLALAYVNSHFQTGLRNVLDRALLAHEASHAHGRVDELVKVDEIPFDFERRIMSVVVRTPEGMDRLIAKGAPEALLPKCVSVRLDGALHPMDHPQVEQAEREYQRLSADGFRVLALATKVCGPHGAVAAASTPYTRADERELILEGFLAFLDPPKESARAAISALEGHGVSVKVITGDNELVARQVCRQVGLGAAQVLSGDAVDALSDAELTLAAERVGLFARVSPAHKQRIVKALQRGHHTVGFMGDGINDAPALHAADVGISFDTAVDIAKESADLILLEKSLLVLDAGALEGRRVFSNIIKYVRMGASSNFGNMLSVLGASVMVPYLPMLPIQILANNLLYDLGQTAIPTDAVDPERIERPRAWDLAALTRFILFVGPCSSLFDYSTFLLMLYVFGCADVSTPELAARSEGLFRTGWFLESLLSQTLVIHVIRTNKLPFLQSRPSPALVLTSAAVIVAGLALPFTPLGLYLGFVQPPAAYWPYLLATLAAYLVLTQLVKSWLVSRRWI